MVHAWRKYQGLRPVLAALLGIGLLAISTSARAEESLDAVLEPVRQEFGLPALAAAVVKDGRLIASGTIGTRVLGRDLPVARDDRFHIGSDTKAMTATLAAMLVEEGKLRWDSTIGEVLALPGRHPKFAAVTLEQLLSHTSGIPSDNEEIVKLYFDGASYELDLVDDRLRVIKGYGMHEPNFPKDGSTFQYSNLGYLSAGAMIEKAAGEPWEELIRRRIFRPLGLETAGLGPQATRGKIDAPIAHFVDDKGKVTPHYWGNGADVPATLGPAGVAHLSIQDFAKWAAWNAGQGKRGPALVKPETLERLHRQHVEMTIADPRPGTPKSGGYALGWGLITFPFVGHPVLTHNGSNGMNLATIFVDPTQDFAIVTATNFPGQKADDALQRVVRMLYERYAAKAGGE